jgi:hypothetical protein
MTRTGIALLAWVIALPTAAEPVTVAGAPVYLTRSDCQALVRHHPAAGTAYQPGVDVHGKYVAPADLPGDQAYKLPDKVEFDLKINPLAYGTSASQGAGAASTTGTTGTTATTGAAAGGTTTAKGPGLAPNSPYANTAMTIGHVAVDLGSGRATLDGRPLDGDQESVAEEACRHAGYR